MVSFLPSFMCITVVYVSIKENTIFNECAYHQYVMLLLGCSEVGTHRCGRSLFLV